MRNNRFSLILILMLASVALVLSACLDLPDDDDDDDDNGSSYDETDACEALLDTCKEAQVYASVQDCEVAMAREEECVYECIVKTPDDCQHTLECLQATETRSHYCDGERDDNDEDTADGDDADGDSIDGDVGNLELCRDYCNLAGQCNAANVDQEMLNACLEECDTAEQIGWDALGEEYMGLIRCGNESDCDGFISCVQEAYPGEV